MTKFLFVVFLKPASKLSLEILTHLNLLRSILPRSWVLMSLGFHVFLPLESVRAWNACVFMTSSRVGTRVTKAYGLQRWRLLKRSWGWLFLSLCLVKILF